MPKACVEKMIKQGKTPAQAHKLCYSGQKAGTSAKEEQRRTRGALAEAHTSIVGPMGKMRKGKKGKGIRRIASKSY